MANFVSQYTVMAKKKSAAKSKSSPKKNANKSSKTPAKKAAAKKAAVKKAPVKKALSLTSNELVAAVATTSVPANINVVFRSGLGQLTASLFRRGVLINMQSISNDGTILLSDVQQRDVISINGVCTGTADITITVRTSPATPQRFSTGPIHRGYIVL